MAGNYLSGIGVGSGNCHRTRRNALNCFDLDAVCVEFISNRENC